MSLQLGKAWLHNCLNTHSSCGPRNPEAVLPTRLLDVGNSGSDAIRLVMGSSLDHNTRYATLSYRWGIDKSFVLTAAKLDSYQESIVAKDLPATLRDATKVTRALGLRYLWVDSMCIVQDDSADWNYESLTMSRVYGQSTCTIAAAASISGNGGCFVTRNQFRIRPCTVPNPFKTDSKYSFHVRSQYLNEIHAREIRRSVWYKRGWVFQERTLSPRLIIFSGSQILWDCNTIQAAETWPCGKTGKDYIDQFESLAKEKARFETLLDPLQGVSRDHTAWWSFIKGYIPSELTLQSDRLVALEGVATLIEKLTGQKYCCGLWLNDDLPRSLLWRPSAPQLSRSVGRPAPSWSWASIAGDVQLDCANIQGKNLATVCIKGYAGQSMLYVEGVVTSATVLIALDGAWGRLAREASVEKWRQLVVERAAEAERMMETDGYVKSFFIYFPAEPEEPTRVQRVRNVLRKVNRAGHARREAELRAAERESDQEGLARAAHLPRTANSGFQLRSALHFRHTFCGTKQRRRCDLPPALL